MEVPQKRLEIELSYDPSTSLLGVSLEKTKTISERHMNPSAHSSTVYNRRGKEASQMSVDR